MAFSYGFFNAKNMDRVYTAEDFTGYLSSIICNGIFDTYGDCFSVTATDGLSVQIGTGKAWIDGHYFTSDSAYTLDLSNNCIFSTAKCNNIIFIFITEITFVTNSGNSFAVQKLLFCKNKVIICFFYCCIPYGYIF